VYRFVGCMLMFAVHKSYPSNIGVVVGLLGTHTCTRVHIFSTFTFTWKQCTCTRTWQLGTYACTRSPTISTYAQSGSENNYCLSLLCVLTIISNYDGNNSNFKTNKGLKGGSNSTGIGLISRMTWTFRRSKEGSSSTSSVSLSPPIHNLL